MVRGGVSFHPIISMRVSDKGGGLTEDRLSATLFSVPGVKDKEKNREDNRHYDTQPQLPEVPVAAYQRVEG